MVDAEHPKGVPWFGVWTLPVEFGVLSAAVSRHLRAFIPGFVEVIPEDFTDGRVIYHLEQKELGSLGDIEVRRAVESGSILEISTPLRPTIKELKDLGKIDATRNEIESLGKKINEAADEMLHRRRAHQGKIVQGLFKRLNNDPALIPIAHYLNQESEGQRRDVGTTGMDEFTEREHKRHQFLHRLYNVTSGDTRTVVKTWEHVGGELGFTKRETDRITRYLEGEGLINFQAQQGAICITHRGIVQVEEDLKRGLAGNKPMATAQGNDVFVVHGRDEAAKEAVARFIEKLALRAIILHERPNAGRTIMEKFEDYSDVGFAVVLLTPDDVGAPQDRRNEVKPRARQNVIFELGYFVGKLGRNRVCALYKEDVEIPSDYHGVLYVPMDSGGAWRMGLAREIKHAGIEIDLDDAL